MTRNESEATGEREEDEAAARHLLAQLNALLDLPHEPEPGLRGQELADAFDKALARAQRPPRRADDHVHELERVTAGIAENLPADLSRRLSEVDQESERLAARLDDEIQAIVRRESLTESGSRRLQALLSILERQAAQQRRHADRVRLTSDRLLAQARAAVEANQDEAAGEALVRYRDATAKAYQLQEDADERHRLETAFRTALAKVRQESD